MKRTLVLVMLFLAVGYGFQKKVSKMAPLCEAAQQFWDLGPPVHAGTASAEQRAKLPEILSAYLDEGIAILRQDRQIPKCPGLRRKNRLELVVDMRMAYLAAGISSDHYESEIRALTIQAIRKEVVEPWRAGKLSDEDAAQWIWVHVKQFQLQFSDLKLTKVEFRKLLEKYDQITRRVKWLK